MGEGHQDPDGRHADGPVVGLTGARFGGSVGRRLREQDASDDEGRTPTTHRRTRRRPVTGQTGARFGGAAGLTASDEDDTEDQPENQAEDQTGDQGTAEDEPREGAPVVAAGDADPGETAAATSAPAAAADPPPPQEPEADWTDPAESFRLVRPYTWTNGRTASRNELAIEALISATGEEPDAMAAPEHQAVLSLCATPRSVAELAALLAVPLGVARVLLGDMAEAGIVRVHRTAGWEGAPDLDLMKRVLDALHRL